MNYSVQNLTQVVDCDVLLSWAQKEKADLNHKRYSEESVTTKYGQTALEIEASLQALVAEIAYETAAIENLPDGPAKEERIFKKKQLEYKQVVLEHRRKSYGVVALLEQEADLGRIDQEIQEVDVFIQAVKARKEALTA